jgi:hypothetical protein
MNLVANHFLYECIQTEESSENVDGEVEEEVEEQPNETTMVLWDMFPGLNLVEEEETSKELHV